MTSKRGRTAVSDGSSGEKQTQQPTTSQGLSDEEQQSDDDMEQVAGKKPKPNASGSEAALKEGSKKATKGGLPTENKYQYSSLEEVLNMYPIEKGMKVVHVYGVICAFHHEKGELTIMDESRQMFQLFINVMFDPKVDSTTLRMQPPQQYGQKQQQQNPPLQKRLPLRTGDIIRIHRLGMFNDLTRRCPYAKNVMIFESFKNKTFCPLHLSRNPTLTASDKARVIALSEWSCDKLLQADVKQTRCKAYNLTNSAFQVLAILRLDKRTILACWNGKPFTGYPSSKLFGVEPIQTALRKCIAHHLYTDEHIARLHEEFKLVFITVFGLHRVVADALRPLDFIVVYNLLIKPDDFHFGKWSYLVYDGIIFGRTIRLCDTNSLIAKKLRERIECYYLLDGDIPNYDDYNFDRSQSQIMSPSKIYDVTTDDEHDESDREDNIDLKRDAIMNKMANLKKTIDNEPAYASRSSIKLPKFPQKKKLTTFIEESSTLNESTLGKVEMKRGGIECTHLQLSIFEKDVIYKNFFTKSSKNRFSDFSDSPIVHLRSFHDMILLLTKPSQPGKPRPKVFQIEAQFYSYIFPTFEDPLDQDGSSQNTIQHHLFDSVDNLRVYASLVECTSGNAYRVCEYRQPFQHFIETSFDTYDIADGAVVLLGADPHSQTHPVAGSSASVLNVNHLDRLRCPQCSLNSCILSLDFRIILQDYDRQLLLTKLSGQQANCLFSTSTADLCSRDSKICERISALFKYMSHITNDRSECSQKITWTIRPKEIDGLCTAEGKEFEYEIVDWSLLTSVGTGTRL